MFLSSTGSIGENILYAFQMCYHVCVRSNRPIRMYEKCCPSFLTNVAFEWRSGEVFGQRTTSVGDTMKQLEVLVTGLGFVWFVDCGSLEWPCWSGSSIMCWS
jgi:hypothetical protein